MVVTFHEIERHVERIVDVALESHAGLEGEGRRVHARLRRAVDERLRGAEMALAQRRRRLEALSPDLVLARGYSITLDERGRLLRSASDTAPDREIQVRLAEGALSAQVREVRP